MTITQMSRTLPLLLALVATPLLADDAKTNAAKPKTDDKPKETVEEKITQTAHEVEIDGQTVGYVATAGRMALRNDEGEPIARVFFIAYHKTGDTKPQYKSVPTGPKSTKGALPDPDPARPVTFCFNGGPGSSSVWLHLGMLGPRRVVLSDDATPVRPPFEMTDNEFSLLDKTDLVFIDPVSTGFSRAEEEDKKSAFHGYDEDLQSVAHFIHNYVSRFNRWGSPKFILGESYGGLRVAGLTGRLRDVFNIELNGAVIVSGVVNFQTLAFAEGNDLPYWLFVPTYAATAWYHGKLSDELQSKPVAEVVKMAEEFAAGPYAKVLAAAAGADPKERKEVIQRYSELTGLSTDFLEDVHLRVHMQQFGRELLREDDKTLGRFDGRYTTPVFYGNGETPEYDASGAAIFGPFTAAINHYLSNELNVPRDTAPDGIYEILTGKVRPWNYGPFENRYVNASGALSEAMTANPFLHLFVAAGYYDLATPHFAIDYTLDHLTLPPERRENVRTEYYEGGHMMYVHTPSLEKMRADLVEWYATALGD